MISLTNYILLSNGPNQISMHTLSLFPLEKFYNHHPDQWLREEFRLIGSQATPNFFLNLIGFVIVL